MELLDDAALVADGNPGAPLPVQAFGKDGDLPIDLELSLVVQSAQMAKNFIGNRQWTLLYRDADLAISIAASYGNLREYVRPCP